MPQFHDKPARPEAKLAPSHRRRLSKAEVERALYTMQRFKIAQAAGTAVLEGRDMVAAVRAITTELGGWTPTPPTIRNLGNHWVHGPERARTDPSYYQVVSKGGRHRATLAEALQTVLDAEIRENPRLSTHKLIARLEKVATAFGMSLPGEWALRRIIEEARGGVLGRSAAAHGRRAAEIDGVAHETLPFDKPYDCLVADEVVWPIWTGMWHETRRCWVSTMLYVVLVFDYASRAWMSWQVCDPTRRRDPKTGAQLFTGFDMLDVMTAFLKVARPELAPDCLKPFAGYLPQCIRMDGHASHVAWKKAVQPFIPGSISILSDHRPFENGVQERAGFTVKEEFDAFFADVPGNVNGYIPTDRLGQNQHEARVQGAATTERPRRKKEILPQDLPRLDELDLIILPHLAEHYNYERKHSAHGMTPYDAFMSMKPRTAQLTPGDALVRALPAGTFLNTRGSIQVELNKVVHQFDHRVNGRILPVGAHVTAHMHPLMECLWAVEGADRMLVHIRRLRDVAEPGDPAKAGQHSKLVAKARAAVTGALSERAQQAFDLILARRAGEEGARATREAAEQNIAGKKGRAGKSLPSGDPAPTRSPTPDGADGTPNLIEQVMAGSETPLTSARVWFGMGASLGAVGDDSITDGADDVANGIERAGEDGAVPAHSTRGADGVGSGGAARTGGRAPRPIPEPSPGPPPAARRDTSTTAAFSWLTGLSGIANPSPPSASPPTTGQAAPPTSPSAPEAQPAADAA